MAKLLMMRGLPGSGKTTKANEIMREAGNFVRVNRDQLRPMLHGDAKWSGKKEKITRKVQTAMVSSMLNEGLSVIVDDTNLRDFDRDRWSAIAREHNSKFEVVDMDTPYDECVERVSNRQNSVGFHVVTSMALSSGRFPYRNIILCDIDGTIADLTHRLHHIKGDVRDWDHFFAGVMDDGFKNEVWENVVADAEENSAVIIFLSGRSDICRADTEMWLEENTGIEQPIVLMRQSWDRRPDTDVKSDIFNWHFKGYNIIRVYDDRPRLVRMWKDMGLSVVDCGDGTEF